MAGRPLRRERQNPETTDGVSVQEIQKTLDAAWEELEDGKRPVQTLLTSAYLIGRYYETSKDDRQTAELLNLMMSIYKEHLRRR